ncbi:2-succinyl-6-hydroxy-2,4-cyclohexadiene-1-carboxylate synthase [Porphyridium purpureum]|uniref:2-succinyl-6-hydroxy-2, 4-cyclohexadiene-1-carboxylate synthase n=1 Tax=Porphyridium purpureum TaxID=35688 RepID=A0A5J4YSN3_PORPP|nr:2-succinyl-6-hydroxy-2,4-cyclohexadiene-1-carboxylate synthase [Porphyridium purpureum]|eukprot:POR9845..scf229_5
MLRRRWFLGASLGNERGQRDMLAYELYRARDSRNEQVSGEHDAAPVLVLLHGMFGAKEDWRELVEVLDTRHRAVALDLPFHGDSAKIRTDSVCGAAHMVLNTCVQLNLHRIVLVGYSLGGRVLVEILNILCQGTGKDESVPIQVECAVLLSAGLGHMDEKERTARMQKDDNLTSRLESFGTPTQMHAFLASEWYQMPMWGSLSRDQTFMDSVVKTRSQRNKGADMACAMHVYSPARQKYVDLPSALTGVPLMYAFGQDDKKYTQVAASHTVQTYARVVLGIPGAGHNVVHQAAEILACNIEAFLWMYGGSVYPECAVSVIDGCRRDYSIGLLRPIQLDADHLISDRDGSLLVLKSAHRAGVGDVAPLPGFSVESLEEARRIIDTGVLPGIRTGRKLAGRLLPGRFRLDDHAMRELVDDLCAEPALPASVRTGLEMALLTLVIQHRPSCLTWVQALSALCGFVVPTDPNRQNHAAARIHVNGVVPRFTGTNGSALSELRALHEQGFHVLKLKIGAQAVDQDASLVHRIASLLPPETRLRLDVNQTWSLADLHAFTHRLEPSLRGCIEYVEEPLAEYDEDSIACMRESGLCYALDESLVPWHAKQAALVARMPPELLGGLVLKPLLMQGYSELVHICKSSRASHPSVQLVLSSCYESGVSLAWQSVFASVLDTAFAPYPSTLPLSGVKQTTFHGLGTGALLVAEQDLLQPAFDVTHRTGACVSLPSCVDALEAFLQSAASVPM